MLTTIVALAALAQIPNPPPLYSGIDSIGARPSPQLPDPVLIFEAKAPWPALGIELPRTAWEFAQRGIYKQDDLEDIPGAIEDYKTALSMNSHLLIVSARLGNLAFTRAKTETSSAAAIADLDEAVHYFEEVEHEQPHRQGIHSKLGDIYVAKFRITGEMDDAMSAEVSYQRELSLNANSQSTHYALAFLYRDLGRLADARASITAYLTLTELHSDPFPYKILKAQKLRDSL